MRFLHCSDIHVTGDYRTPTLLQLGWRRWPALAELKIRGRSRAFENSAGTIRRIVGEFATHHVDHLIVSGDVTAYALESEFDGVKAALSPLADDPRRCTVIHGNHDMYTPGAIRDQRFERRFGHLLKSDLPQFCAEGAYPFVRLLDDGAAVIGIRSPLVPFVPGCSFGRIKDLQLQALEAAITSVDLKDRAVLVVVHHAPLKANGHPDKPLHGLWDAAKLFKIVRGPKRAVLHGHIHHRFYHSPTSDRPHIFGAGSSTQLGREGYWLIDVRNGEFVSHQQLSLTT